MPFEKMAQASKVAAYGVSGGGAVAACMQWIQTNQATAMVLIALATYATNALINYWYKSHLLAIAERRGVNGEED